MDFQDIFIIGATGKVGRTLVSQILNRSDSDRNEHEHPTRIVGVASSSRFIYYPEGINDERCIDFSSRKGKGRKYSSLSDMLDKAGRSEHVVFIDVTASKDIADFHLKVIEDTSFGIVTANKNPLALSDHETFQRLTKEPGRYGFRCSVMAGAEAVSFLQDLRDVNDMPTQISGCFSGTLGYICSELEKNRLFSGIIREAREKGYTEPHPRDDLNGLDVARKLLILARTAGYNAEMKDIEVIPFIPHEYLSEDDAGRFIESAAGLDDHFSGKVEDVLGRGSVLRYVARMDGGNLEVSLQEVPKNSPLGSLSGTLNKIVVVSETYPAGSPYSVEAPGAGLEVTAQNIRRDLLHQLEDRRYLVKGLR